MTSQNRGLQTESKTPLESKTSDVQTLNEFVEYLKNAPEELLAKSRTRIEKVSQKEKIEDGIRAEIGRIFNDYPWALGAAGDSSKSYFPAGSRENMEKWRGAFRGLLMEDMKKEGDVDSLDRETIARLMRFMIAEARMQILNSDFTIKKEILDVFPELKSWLPKYANEVRLALIDSYTAVVMLANLERLLVQDMSPEILEMRKNREERYQKWILQCSNIAREAIFLNSDYTDRFKAVSPTEEMRLVTEKISYTGKYPALRLEALPDFARTLQEFVAIMQAESKAVEKEKGPFADALKKAVEKMELEFPDEVKKEREREITFSLQMDTAVKLLRYAAGAEAAWSVSKFFKKAKSASVQPARMLAYQLVRYDLNQSSETEKADTINMMEQMRDKGDKGTLDSGLIKIIESYLGGVKAIAQLEDVSNARQHGR